MTWFPMFALPNIHLTLPVEVPSLALVYAEDSRVQTLANNHASFKIYLDRFSTEFGDKLVPSLLIWDDKGPQGYRSTEALAAFRDALALSVVPRAWAHYLRYERPEKLRFSNYFSIYPWMTTSNYEHVIMRSSAVLGIHDIKLLHAQSSPGLLQEVVSEREVDQTLHKELMVRWKRRFGTDQPHWDDVKLFRSLNMANVAALLPSQGDFTPYDAGRSVALWVSAFEILAHPGEGQSGYLQVYELLEKAKWHLTACKEARHPATVPKGVPRDRILACAIYSRIYRARNDYLHGNRVSDIQLSEEPSGRFLPDYAALLYRMALTGFLGLQFEEREPDRKDIKAFEAYQDRWFDHTKYQRDVEAAIATIYVSVHKQREQAGLMR